MVTGELEICLDDKSNATLEAYGPPKRLLQCMMVANYSRPKGAVYVEKSCNMLLHYTQYHYKCGCVFPKDKNNKHVVHRFVDCDEFEILECIKKMLTGDLDSREGSEQLRKNYIFVFQKEQEYVQICDGMSYWIKTLNEKNEIICPTDQIRIIEEDKGSCYGLAVDFVFH